MTHLFTPITFRGLEIRNRIGISPMCQYSSQDGFATDWHVQHLGSRAAGGAGLVMMEATAISPEGRITPGCNGIWKDTHIAPLKRVTDFVKSQGAAIGIQLAHAGRKASMDLPWNGGRRLVPENGGWQTIAPSPISFAPDHQPPQEMTIEDIARIKADFVAAAKRAVEAGFQIVELHGAHGYLLHEFFSPLSNQRTDAYGGSEENRFRLILEVATAVRAILPDDIVLGTRLSCTDWVQGGLESADTARLSARLKDVGVDFIDCSSGGAVLKANIPAVPDFQVPFATKIRKEAEIPAAAVGLITTPEQADKIIREGLADMVFIGRASLQDAYWPLHAAMVLGQAADIPPQYLRGYETSSHTKRKIG